MNRTLFGPTTGGMAQPIRPLMPAKLGLPMQRGRGRPGSAQPQIGPAFSRPSGLQMFAGGGSVPRMAGGGALDMSEIMRELSLHSMPNRAVPEYLMARMADGGDVDPFRMPGRMSVDAARERRKYRQPGLGAELSPIDYANIRDLPKPEREMSMLSARPFNRGRRGQRDALWDIYNADAIKRMDEADPWWHDLVAGMADPTSAPVNWSGMGILPKLTRGLMRKMPNLSMKGNLGMMGAWSASGSNIEDAGSGLDEDTRWRFGFRDLPPDLRFIGDR